ncbi:PAS domain-containing protein [Marinomonas ostreistagni]|uniref:PAS domain-containing protein n=1 Tax=Marinomonas ostreistagni TaxID=359209 RepID=UPI0019508622|nr:PAS domain-containing protein [Marinomonas ostreistagni]MBM6551475.1 PAS domain-containing protein [Marinomonas ostreistagni]
MKQAFVQVDGFETVFRDSKDGLAIFKGDVFVDCNQSMLDLVGASERSQFVGNTPDQFSPEWQPDGRSSYEKSIEMIEQCYRDGSVRFEWVHKKLNGDEFWAEVILTKMVLDGEVVLHTNWRDISRKKVLELETQAQKETFETLFNESEDGLCLLTTEHYIDCNKAFMHLFGAQDKQEIIGITPIDLSPEYQPDGQRSADKAIDIINTAFTEGTIHFEWVHQKFDGTPFWCEIILFKINVNDTDVLYAITRDISAKKALELELAEQKETFETLFNESLDGLCLLNSEYYFDCNKTFMQLFGAHSKEEIIGITPIDLSPEYQPDGQASKDKAVAIIETAFTQGTINFEWVHRKLDGTEFWCEIILFKINLNGTDVLYAITRDISEKKALELEVQERNEELKASNAHLEETIQHLEQAQDKLVESEKMASLGSLVAGVAHEINTPVGIGLTGVSQLVEDCQAITERYQQGCLTETDFEDFLGSVREISNIVQKNLERTAHLVRSFKQVAVDQTSEEDRQVNLKHYIEEVVFSLASVLRKTRATVNVDCAEDYNVLVNPGLLSQVLTNLIVNSVNHGFSESSSGQITIALSPLSDTEFLLRYQDDGKGIEPANLNRIFDPFFTTQRGAGGTGLGLNITYNIVTNALGGSIVCHSELGQGVEFDIRFQVAKRYH